LELSACFSTYSLIAITLLKCNQTQKTSDMHCCWQVTAKHSSNALQKAPTGAFCNTFELHEAVAYLHSTRDLQVFILFVSVLLIGGHIRKVLMYTKLVLYILLL